MGNNYKDFISFNRLINCLIMTTCTVHSYNNNNNNDNNNNDDNNNNNNNNNMYDFISRW